MLYNVYITFLKGRYDQMKYENPSLCALCGGNCCKADPCFFMPDDFSDLSVKSLIREFEQKDYLCIYCSAVPFISIRAKDWPRVVSQFSKKKMNPCILLTPTGCPFSYKERPSGGKMLVPNSSGDCRSLLSLLDVHRAWYPYMETLFQVAKHLC